MISTLIKTLTADGDSTLSFVDGTSDVVLDNTYDAYMFVFTDIGPATDGVEFMFQANEAGASGYNELLTSQFFEGNHDEADNDTNIQYIGGHDQPQGTAFQALGYSLGNGSDESLAGILHLFSPANATFVTHYSARTQVYRSDDYAGDQFCGGYFNKAADISSTGGIAIDEIQFKMSSGDFDGVIHLYGIA